MDLGKTARTIPPKQCPNCQDHYWQEPYREGFQCKKIRTRNGYIDPPPLLTMEELSARHWASKEGGWEKARAELKAKRATKREGAR